MRSSVPAKGCWRILLTKMRTSLEIEHKQRTQNAKDSMLEKDHYSCLKDEVRRLYRIYSMGE